MTASPGPQLSVGRLRVDAARAIAKLRDYQLADKTQWILEGVRAAVASGATAITVDGDSNDVWLRWVGPVWSADELPRLFDELVSPEPAREGHHLRLLATAVNSALGLRPAYVDVIAIPDAGPALSARYEPDVLTDAASDLLRAIRVRAIERPDGVAGMLVHLRRPPGLDTLSYLLHGATPPELAVAAGACRDLAVPIHVAGELLEPRDLVRVPLGDDLTGFLAIVDPADCTLEATVMDVAERGVVLARYEIYIEIIDARGPLPVRLFVDAPRMPTNASRSQVRRDEHPIAAAQQRAKQVFPELVAKLAAKATSGERERAAALALVAAAIAGPDWREASCPQALWPLIALPLLRNAVGESRAISARWQPAVHVAREPLATELAPWLSDMLWIAPGDDAERLVAGAGIDAREARQSIRWARRQLSARAKFHRHERRVARVNSDAEPRMRVRIGAELASSTVQQTLFDDVDGELCIRGDGVGGEVVALLDGREIDRLHVDAGFPFDAAVESTRLSPSDRYHGVQRDDGFRRVEAALRAALVRGIEAIALVLLDEPLPPGYTAGPPDRETDARYVRGAFEIAIAAESPLVRAPAWPSFDGRWLSLAELRALPAFGVALFDPPHVRDRVVIRADAGERRWLRVNCPVAHVIDYERAPRAPIPPAGCRLAVTEPGISGTIEPATYPSLVLRHAGAQLAEMPYKSKLVPCRIIADVDAAIPDPSWAAAIDTGGVERVDFEPWERALVVAIAGALVGDPIEALAVPPGQLGASGPVARTLWTAIGRQRDVVDLLGSDLHARLRDDRMFHVHGDPDPKSATDLAAMFPVQLPYVDGGSSAVAGFSPLVADLDLAQAVAVLSGRVAVDGVHELERRRSSAERDARLIEHRAKPTVPIALAGGLRIASGTIAVGRGDGIEIEILVESIAFEHAVIAADVPVTAVIDVDEAQVDATFSTLTGGAFQHVIAEIRAAVPALVLRDATAKPEALGDPGPLRALVVAALDRDLLDHATREALCAIAGFQTVQGGRVALASMRADTVLGATWDQPWLVDERVDRLDRPVLRVPAGDAGAELRRIAAALIRTPLVDASREVDKLQGQRQISRGMLPLPTVVDARPELKKRLDELGELGRELGPGEIALVTESQAVAQLHVASKPRLRVELDVLPPVCIAIEAPDLVAEIESLGNLSDAQRAAMTSKVQELALRLVRRTVTADTLLPAQVRHGLRRAILACRFDLAEIGGTPVIETTAGAWLPWSALDDQVARFGDVWSTRPGSSQIPLDDARIALRLTDIEIQHGRAVGIPIVDASHELELDDIARRNRARRPAITLDIAPNDGYLGYARLPGDGTTSPRGMVALLHPRDVSRRGIVPHRAMHPFDPVTDPCAWPTVALVDDARLTPGRTWERPVDDAVWQAIARDVQIASDAAWSSIKLVPSDALASVAVAPSSLAGLSSCADNPDLQLHGALWLGSRSETITVVGEMTAGHGLRRDVIGGRLFVYAQRGWRRDSVVNELCIAAYPALVRQAIASYARAPDRVAAHAAMALALGRIGPSDATGISFDCFEQPVGAEELVGRLRHHGPVHVADRDTELVAAVTSYLGERARRGAFLVRWALPGVARPPSPPPRPPVPIDPHDALAIIVRRRLDELEVGWTGPVEYDPTESQLACMRAGSVVIGSDPRVARFIANPALVDLLVAHVISVLGDRDTAITSSTQATAVYRLLRQ